MIRSNELSESVKYHVTGTSNSRSEGLANPYPHMCRGQVKGHDLSAKAQPLNSTPFFKQPLPIIPVSLPPHPLSVSLSPEILPLDVARERFSFRAERQKEGRAELTQAMLLLNGQLGM